MSDRRKAKIQSELISPGFHCKALPFQDHAGYPAYFICRTEEKAKIQSERSSPEFRYKALPLQDHAGNPDRILFNRYIRNAP